MTTATIDSPRTKRGWSETAKNYWLDVVLFVAFVIDMNTRFTGIPIHEWLGIAFGIALFYHLMLHWVWITTTTKRLFGKLPKMQRARYVINLALFIDMVVIVISGIWISEAALPQLGIPITPSPYFFEVHHISSELSVILLGLHLALDWKWIVTNSKRYLFGLFSRSTKGAAS